MEARIDRRTPMKALIALAVAATLLVAPGAQASRRADRTAPAVVYETQDEAILLSNPTGSHDPSLPVEVTGRATDARGVARIEGIFLPCTTASEDSCSYSGFRTPFHKGGATALACTPRARSCAWRVPTPTVPGTYWFVAVATDRAGNESIGSGILTIYVV
jgi:hypothetical protein